MGGKTISPVGSIDRYVLPYLESLPDLSGKTAIDIPAGEGRASYMFAEKGAHVRAFDLYPEFTKVEGVKGEYADLNDGVPVEDGYADYLICQEGIEHMPDKFAIFQEFNRVLKKGGTLIITTPNLSNARGRVWMALIESDSMRRMPVTEIDSLWFTEQQTDRLYFGHLFLSGVQHLQTLCTITGFEIIERRATAKSTTSIILGVLMYPFLVLASLGVYFTYRRKNQQVEPSQRNAILWKRVKLNLAPQTLFGKHMFWVLRKEKDFGECVAELKKFTLKSHA